MKKIVLQTESCIGCGACVGIDSEHFEFSDDGFSEIKSQENLDSPTLLDAIDACPVAIISLEDDGTSSENDEETELNQRNACPHSDCHCDSCSCEEVEDNEEKAA